MTFAKTSIFTALQEVHATNDQFKAHFTELHATHFLFCSPSSNAAAAGGVATCINKMLLPPDSTVSFDTVVPGRALAATVTHNSAYLHHLNLHNENLQPHETKAVCNWLAAKSKLAAEQPQCHAVLATGDWNFEADGKSSTSMKNLSAVVLNHSATNAGALVRTLSLFTELASFEDTHFNKAELATSNLDRTFVFCPASLLLNVKKNITVLDDPTALHAARISDHAAVQLRLSVRPPTDKSTRPIPNRICKSSTFRNLHKCYIDAANLENLDPFLRYEMHKEIIKETAA